MLPKSNLDSQVRICLLLIWYHLVSCASVQSKSNSKYVYLYIATAMSEPVPAFATSGLIMTSST